MGSSRAPIVQQQSTSTQLPGTRVQQQSYNCAATRDECANTKDECATTEAAHSEWPGGKEEAQRTEGHKVLKTNVMNKEEEKAWSK